MVNISNLITCISLNNQPCMSGPAYVDLFLINVITDYVTIHLWLIKIDALGVLILSFILLVEYVFQIKWKTEI